jgi:predicted negative regulator of RcsB-dependent stress response
VDPYGTEEDQIKALKQWWERNGSSTLIGIGLALALVFGWQWWQQRQQGAGDQAAATYQQLLQAVDAAAGDPVQRTTAEHLAAQLKELKPGSRYADYAALMLARLHVEKNELVAAEGELRALLERQPDVARGALAARLDGLLGRYADPQLGALARVRLARVLLALGRSDDALAVLDAAGTDDFAVEKLELRGDILGKRNDTAGAIKAYRAAVELAGSRDGAAASRLLALKLQELEMGEPPAGAAPAAAQPAAAADAAATAPDTGATKQ